MPVGFITEANCKLGVYKLSLAFNFNLKSIRNTIFKTPLKRTSTEQPSNTKSSDKESHETKSYLKQAIKQIFRLEYLLFVFWSTLSYMGHFAFIVTFPEYSATTAPDEATGRGYVDFYGNISFVSALIAIMVALVIDFKARKYTDQGASFHFKIIAFGVLALASVLFSCLRYALQWTLDERYVKINVILFLVSLPCLTGQQSVYVRCNFPVEHFGLLSGLVRTVMSTSICL